MSRIYFVAGETSGDNHGAALMQALRRFQPGIEFFGRGGPKMRTMADPSFLDWSAEAGVVGLWEVMKHYPFFRREFARTLEEISVAKPDAVVLIDYPGFNLRLARALHERSLGGKVIFYISPQVWAWNRGRIPKMARWLDLMLCIFPFEAQLYERSGLRAVFVGHPMTEDLGAKRMGLPRDPNLIGLFPGSRAREVRQLMPILIEAMRILSARQPGLHFEVAAASEALADKIREMIRSTQDSLGKINLTVGQAHLTMQRAAAGVVASGTATLEAAFFRLPFVLVYKVTLPTYLAGKMLVRVKHLGMPNVLAGREIVPEFIQQNARPQSIADAILQLLNDQQYRARMISDFEEVIASLGKGGANEVAARAILDTVSTT
jgi:lipid-A-disaccharide synthase